MEPRPTYEDLDQRVKHLEEEVDKSRNTEAELRKVLEQSRQRSSSEISTLLEGYRTLLTHHRFIDIARTLYDLSKTLIGSTAGYVALLNETCSENEVLFLDSGELPCTVDPNLPMPIRGLRGEAYRKTKPAFHNDFSKSEWAAYMPEGHVKLNNVLFAPLLLEGRAIGVLGYANKPDGFSESDAQLASVFAEFAAIALNKSNAKNIWQKEACDT
jgi:GAF domain-containing protein